MNIKDIVKGRVARFSFYRAGYAFYEVEVEGTKYKFPISLEDLEPRLSWRSTRPSR